MGGMGPGGAGRSYSGRNITINELRDAVSIDPKLLEKIDRMDRNFEIIMERLAILDNPTPEKLEQFEILKVAYTKYKFIEKLCGEEE